MSAVAAAGRVVVAVVAIFLGTCAVPKELANEVDTRAPAAITLKSARVHGSESTFELDQPRERLRRRLALPAAEQGPQSPDAPADPAAACPVCSAVNCRF